MRFRAARGLSAGVSWVALAQLAREAICFFCFAGLAKRQRSFVQCARCYGRVVVKQSHALKSFAGVVVISALQLDLAREQTRFRIHASLRLQRHDLFGDFLRLIRFVRADLHCTERE